MTRTVREPTLPLDHRLLERNIGFRSPFLTRAQFRWLGIGGYAQRIWYDSASGAWHAWGWKMNGVYYVTSVHHGLRRGDSYARTGQ